MRVSFQQVQKYENGANRVSFSRLVQIAHALGCQVTDLTNALISRRRPPISNSSLMALPVVES